MTVHIVHSADGVIEGVYSSAEEAGKHRLYLAHHGRPVQWRVVESEIFDTAAPILRTLVLKTLTQQQVEILGLVSQKKEFPLL